MLWNQLRVSCRHLRTSFAPARSLGSLKLSSSGVPNVTSPSSEATIGTGTYCKYTVEEITIPVPTADGGAVLAGMICDRLTPDLWNEVPGQVWRGEPNPQEKMLPPIICSHGLLDNAGSFSGLLPLIMRPNMTALCLDFQGHGLSSHLTTGHYDVILDSCKSLYKAYKYLNTSKVILIGHSMGALTSFLFTALYPECTDRLISIDAHPFTVSHPLDRLKFLMEKQMGIDEKLAEAKPSSSFTYEEILERFYMGRVKGVTLEGCKNLLQRGARQLPDGKYVFSYDLRAAIPCSVGRFSMVEVDHICASIKCPVTWIKADPGGAVGFKTPFCIVEDYAEVVEHLKKYNNNIEFHTVSGTHFLHINNPGAVAPIINSSLGF